MVMKVSRKLAQSNVEKIMSVPYLTLVESRPKPQHYCDEKQPPVFVPVLVGLPTCTRQPCHVDDRDEFLRMVTLY